MAEFNQAVLTFLRHMKDQNKKVANLKHNQQLEKKKKNAQLLEKSMSERIAWLTTLSICR